MTKRILSLLLILCVILSFGTFSFAEEYKELKSGSYGAEVTALQKRLTELGYSTNGIDGSFGDGTKNALLSFQQRNGLTETGIADAETQKVLYSDDAVAIYIPPIEITKVSYSRNNYNYTVYWKNNLSVPVDSVDIKGFGSDSAGKITGTIVTPEEGRYGYVGAWEGADRIVQPNETASGYFYIGDNAKVGLAYFSAYVSGYHTTDGNEYSLSPEQMRIVRSDGYVIEPTSEEKISSVSDSVSKETESVSFGCYLGNIYSWLVPFYNLPEGRMVYNLRPGSMADKAGLMEKDVIIAYDDIPSLTPFANYYAKQKIIDGEQVEVHYIRSNKEYTTTFALDMDSVVEAAKTEEPAGTGEPSLLDQLKELGELYQAGLLTDEEFAAAKAKLLG